MISHKEYNAYRVVAGMSPTQMLCWFCKKTIPTRNDVFLSREWKNKENTMGFTQIIQFHIDCFDLVSANSLKLED